MTLPDLSRYDIVGVDTETTGLEYTDRPVGMSVSTPDGGDFYLAWGHEGGGNNCSLPDVRDWWGEQMRANPRLRLAFFNAGFDMRMMAYVGMKVDGHPLEDPGNALALVDELVPELTLDAMSQQHLGRSKQDRELNEWCAAHFGGQPTRQSQAKNYWRAPADVVAPYAKDDSRNTLDLTPLAHDLLRRDDLEKVYGVEVGLLPLLLKMHMVGVRVDKARAHEVREDMHHRLIALRERWDDITDGVNPNSAPQVGELFVKRGIPVQTTEAGNPSLEKDYLKTIVDRHPLAGMLIELRQLKHYKDTFIGKYILSNARESDVIHGEFHSVRNDRYGTGSGRFSSGGALNLQNIPKRDKVLGPLMRSMYIPYYDGQEWTKFDYSQIEYRFLAHYAGGSLRRAYVDDPHVDFHQAVAVMAAIERDPAKTLNFALCYGQGEEATAEQLRMSLEQARRFIADYHARVPELRPLYESAMNRASRRGYIITWGGRRRHFEPHRFRKGTYDKTHKALNAILQGSAADMIKRAMLRVAEVIDWEDCILHLTVHDELDFSTTPGDVGESYRTRIKECMEDWHEEVEHPLTVPIIAECDVGPNWGHVAPWVPARAAA